MDDQSLRTLAILHRVYGGVVSALACCGVVWISFVFGVIGLAGASTSKPGDAVVAGGVGLIWLIAVGLTAAFASLNFLAASWIDKRRNWIGVVIIAGIDCLNMPLGIALGIFCLITLNKPWVRAQFSS